MNRVVSVLLAVVLAGAAGLSAAQQSAGAGPTIGLNVVLDTPVSDAAIAALASYGTVLNVIPEIRAVTMRVAEQTVPAIRRLSFVAAANPDRVRTGRPVDSVLVSDFVNGMSTWNLDAVDATDYGFDNRQVPFDGTGVIVAVLDTGLLESWRQYLPEQRIAEEWAVAFAGGGGEHVHVATLPRKWERDTDAHGTHVTSTILGYSYRGVPINGVAPMARVIPVKVLNQNGSGWSSVIAHGIVYIATLKAGQLADHPVVINMSLGGAALDAVEKAAIDYAIEQGVIIVASAGNLGLDGMGYPGAYGPVISVAASGWVDEWTAPGWWYQLDVEDPLDIEDYYVADFSSRALEGQDLDVTAPGSWVVGPYQVNSGAISYYYLGGTSMASPHVAGIVALMLQADPTLTAGQVEVLLENSAVALPAGCRSVDDGYGNVIEMCWEDDATGAGLVTVDGALGTLAGASAATAPARR